ncbi:hypothetical protein PHYBLDRAFT_170407 [Phycomyces blakesleeanus NRRL 1555(-)]|uniref:Uncharacterized protein n=1 Tax=Phycomyces blakesleeanus (strain ATCC 8743b / DSM 1359 / FGSC 10004 / NBRC 33097 / NRRL 1555) TaxID=763407 RepID=A0A162PPM9_PHYB8|nr:hypothetical protein PHYBLDRAFT_170407 [Phycomyces blakesleeanus NRRL 1555(-)]OAD71746.1 hypothetical protein PHYBLDRAFT_170407 [Phycomyces blakesleeanus NRRL 1555(-)]|eukprot:XP_018289786.1 hypothetical protein PHYBLDRAFT_170407 [Phycomyces blakesleeanus NRRL 1555(-)]
MNNIDTSVIQLLQGIQDGLISLKNSQEALEKKQDAMQLEITSLHNELNDRELPDNTIVASVNISTDSIPRLVPNICNINSNHVLQMIKQDLEISPTAEVKGAINTCTKHICDQLAALLSVQILGPNPSWTSIPQEDWTRMCVSHSHALKNYGIDFTRCHKNWASITKVSQLWRSRRKQYLSANTINE